MSYLFGFLFLTIPFASASADTSGYMMGAGSWDTNMMQFENSFVEDDALYEQMEEYMEALFSGELTDDQEAQMLEWMQSDQYQPVMMSMMMRNMMGSGWDSGWSNTGMMSSWGYGSLWGIGGWVTMILIWGFLILGIAAFWKSLNRTKK